MQNKDIIILVWKTLLDMKKSGKDEKSEIALEICNKIMNSSIEKGSCDNLSCIFIGFDNFFNNDETLNKILKKIKVQNCNEMMV